MQRYCGDGTRDFWGAQAASLHVSAACRDYLLDALRTTANCCRQAARTPKNRHAAIPRAPERSVRHSERQ